MGKCENCKKEILYNKYKRYRGKILCPECYKTRLPRKKAKKAAREALAKVTDIKKDVKEYFPLEPSSKEDKTDDVKFTTREEETE